MMIVENQQIKVRWVSANKKWYIDKGYIFTKMWDYFYVKVEDLMPTSKYPIKVICDYCGEERECDFGNYNTSIQKNGKYACYNCRLDKAKDSLSKSRYEEIKKRCEELGYTLLSKLEDIPTIHMSIEFICPIHGLQTIRVETLLNGAKCRLCMSEKNGRKRSLSRQSYIEYEISQYGNNKLLNKEEYVHSETKNLKILCGRCGNVFVTDRNTYLKNAKRNLNCFCPDCNLELRKEMLLRDKNEVEQYINSINNNVLLNKDDYKGNDIVNLNIKCGCCGEIFTTSLVGYQAGKIMCSKCSSKISRGELSIKNVLDLYNVNYKQEYWFFECRDKHPLPFDFYLPDYNICIEYQGEQHYKPVSRFGGEESFSSLIYHDQIKRNYCINNNICLIEIPHWEYKNIEHILIEKLNLNKFNENYNFM